MLKSLSSFFITVLFLFALQGCSLIASKEFTAKQGAIDLRKWDIKKIPVVALNGHWELYWNKLFTPDSFQHSSQQLKPTFIRVPDSWTNQQDMPRMDAFGYATYRLTVQLPTSSTALGLYIPKIWSASKVWINDVLVFEAGKMAMERERYEANSVETWVTLPKSDSKIELVVQVANFDLFIGGLVQGFELGRVEVIEGHFMLTRSLNLIWIGVLLIMAVYHLLLYWFRRKQVSDFLFGLICLLIGIRLIIFGDHYLYIYLKNHTFLLPFLVQGKLYYTFTCLLLPFGLMYLHSLYPKCVPVKLVYASLIIGIGYATSIMLVSFPIFSQNILLFQLLVGWFTLLYGWIFLDIILKKVEDASLQLIGISIVLVGGINDGLNTQGIELFGVFELMPVAFGVFLILQFIILARRFTKAFEEVEDLTENLERKVLERTNEINQQKEEITQINQTLVERQNKLEIAYMQIKDSVIYASRIQSAMLAHPDELLRKFEEAFIFYKPRDIVSGDFYWFACIEKEDLVLEKDVPENQFDFYDHLAFERNMLEIVVAVDCTGHGVPGAFMTVMANDFLNEIILEAKMTDPTQILKELDKKVVETLGRKDKEHLPTDGMDLSLIIIDKYKKKLTFAGAKNPLLFIRNGELQEFKASRFSIGSNAFGLEKDFPIHQIDVLPNDKLYLFSDGFQDQFGKGDKKFMKKNFKEMLLAHSHLSMEAQKQTIEKIFCDWKGDFPQTDDVLLIGIQL